jgi:hypothetical protein
LAFAVGCCGISCWVAVCVEVVVEIEVYIVLFAVQGFGCPENSQGHAKILSSLAIWLNKIFPNKVGKNFHKPLKNQ